MTSNERDLILKASASQWKHIPDAGLVVLCKCHRSVFVPFSVLMTYIKPKENLEQITKRMRCRRCHSLPIKVALRLQKSANPYFDNKDKILV